MGFYTVIGASDEQINAFYTKHMKPYIKTTFFRKKITLTPLLESSMKYSYDDEDGIGFFSIHTVTGKKISCQVRGSEPMFVELSGFGDIRYDISYPAQRKNCKEFYEDLKLLCNIAKESFWKGGQI
jgi:hypothetical protein